MPPRSTWFTLAPTRLSALYAASLAALLFRWCWGLCFFLLSCLFIGFCCYSLVLCVVPFCCGALISVRFASQRRLPPVLMLPLSTCFTLSPIRLSALYAASLAALLFRWWWSLFLCGCWAIILRWSIWRWPRSF